MSTHRKHDTANQHEHDFTHASINWIPAVVLVSTPLLTLILVPWYLWTQPFNASVWWLFAFMMAWTGLSITAGYHRLLSHRAYTAHPMVKYFLLLGATFAVQSSAFDWCSGHRKHHRHVDDEHEDPYSARRGFWFSHIGWMLKNYPSGQFDYKNIPDLLKDPILQIQHKYYGIWVLLTNIGIMTLVGWLIGDIAGTLIIAGLLRLVLTHHFTFFINSLCHMFGSRPYTDSNTARDNFVLAIFTWGEGYHNYHHYFQYDYRNGVKWWQYDPTKWLILALSKVGLANDLRTVDDATIKHAEVQMQFTRANARMDKITSMNVNLMDFDNIKTKITNEYHAFNATVEEWQALKKKSIEMKKNEFSERLHEVDEALKDQYKQIEQKIYAHSQQLESVLKQLYRVSV